MRLDPSRGGWILGESGEWCIEQSSRERDAVGV